MKVLSLITLFSCLIIEAHASGGVGNGGDAVVCPNRALDKQVFTLDSYEARKMRFTLDLTNPNIEKQTWRSMVNVAVTRLRKFDRHTASLLYDYAMEMVNDFEKFIAHPGDKGKNVYLGDDVLVKINDSKHTSLPADCDEHPKQMVIQKKPRFSRDFRYEFYKPLWDRMPLLEQTMMILHEAWYRIMLENGAVDSIGARYMNGLVASKDFEEYSFTEYIEELKGTELKKYIVQSNSEALKDQEVIFDLKNHILNIEGDEVCAPNYKVKMNIKETWRIWNQDQRYLKNIKFQNVCFKNSKLTRMVLPTKVVNGETTLRLPFYQIEFGKALDKFPTIFFHQNGKVSHFSGIKWNKFMEMFYKCDGKISYKRSFNCLGPYINHGTKVEKPSDINFDENEKPLDYFIR